MRIVLVLLTVETLALQVASEVLWQLWNSQTIFVLEL
jgi:hypothetical protein